MTEPPSNPGVNSTLTEPIPATSDVIAGAPGDVKGVEDTSNDCGLVPAALMARSRTE
jgi:hypothetical protein